MYNKVEKAMKQGKLLSKSTHNVGDAGVFRQQNARKNSKNKKKLKKNFEKNLQEIHKSVGIFKRVNFHESKTLIFVYLKTKSFGDIMESPRA